MSLRRVLRGLAPAVARPPVREILRAATGAGLGLIACAILVGLPQGLGPDPWLIAPLGATAFLAFAVPNSPLAQPFSAVVGNTVSALVAIATILTVPVPHLAAGLAVMLAIMAMMGLRAMHPPGGAVALLIALNARSVAEAGFAYALTPVMVDTAILVALAVVWNRATGRVYPFRQPPEQGPHATRDPVADRRLGLTPEELSAILERLNLAANIGPEDMARVIGAAEAEATARHFGGLTCADMMSRDLVTLRPDADRDEMAEDFRRHRFKTLPVTDAQGNYLGLVNDVDLISAPADTRAAAIMRDVATAVPSTPVAVLLDHLADGHQQSVPVLDGPRLIGLFTRSDLIAALSRALMLR